MLKQNSDPSHEHDFDVQDGDTQKIHTQDNQDIIMWEESSPCVSLCSYKKLDEIIILKDSSVILYHMIER